MRKIIPLMLIAAMLLSMSLSAAATQSTEAGTTNVKAGYVAGEEGGQIIGTVITGFKEACENVITVAEQLAAGEEVNAHYDIEYILIDSTNIDEYSGYCAGRTWACGS